MGDIALRGQGRALLKKGNKAIDMSEEHESMESEAEEAEEYEMEKLRCLYKLLLRHKKKVEYVHL